MSIDFEIPAEAKAIREKVRQWVQDECCLMVFPPLWRRTVTFPAIKGSAS
jgi:hypothetical protein